MKSLFIAIGLTLALGGSAVAGYCKPNPPTPADISFTGVICQDPRLKGTATNSGETGGTFELRFYSGNRALGFPLRKVNIYVPAESSRDISRWVKGGTAVIARFDGERIFTAQVNRATNVGRCPA